MFHLSYASLNVLDKSLHLKESIVHIISIMSVYGRDILLLVTLSIGIIL